MKSLMVICVMIGVIVVLGCIGQNSNTIKVEKYSERQDGNRDITIYKTPDNRISVTVFKNHHPADFSNMGLTNEIKRIIPNPTGPDWNIPLTSEKIDGHSAVSTRVYQEGEDSMMRTNNVPDLYATAISYPEKDMVLLITSNGYSANWTIQNEMVNKFKL
jgi:hypothetical protein